MDMNGRSRTGFAPLAAAVLTFTCVACSEARSDANAAPARKAKPAANVASIKIGDPAPPFTLLGPDGKAVSLSDYKGKIVVVEEINPECPFCRRQLKAGTEAKIARKYADKGVAWLGVDSLPTHTPAQQEAFAKLYELPFPILSDPTGEVGRSYGMRTTPDVRIVDANGNIAYIGALDNDPTGNKKDQAVDYVSAALDDLVAKRKVRTPTTRSYGCEVMYAPAKPRAKDFTLTDQDGKPVSLSDHAGKIVVLEWINPQCPYSRRHTMRGTMKKLAEKYAPKGVAWLAINSTKHFDVAKNKAWHDENKLPFPILDDHAGTVGHAYDAKTTPDLRIIDRAGQVVYSGAIDDDPPGRADNPTNYVAKALDELLAGKKIATPLTKPYGCSVKYAK